MSSSNLLLHHGACSYLLKWGPESVLCKHGNYSSDLSADTQAGWSPTADGGLRGRHDHWGLLPEKKNVSYRFSKRLRLKEAG